MFYVKSLPKNGNIGSWHDTSASGSPSHATEFHRLFESFAGKGHKQK